MNITSKRDTLKKLYSPFGSVFAKANIHPNVITFSALVVGTIAAFMYYKGHPVIGAFLLFTSGVLDLCDGYVAVNNRKATKFGAVFDWIADKWVDGFVLGSVALRYAGDWIALFVVVVSMLHTFIKPVVYSEIGYEIRETGKIKDPLENTGFFGRPETFVTLFAASLIYPFNNQILRYAIEFIGVMSFLSLMQRIFYLYKNYGREYEE
ncbi:CDP-alcohol phosphatidyltransferase family protein [Desulfurobacterium atlanticum]|uniref:Phosphatidylglycerophosphate synthase n=1 Tax=Desulfurobacterium atlanticum TaxID=240169 RepID=A0A238XPJ4_9BACT|nr:CDP-alcohol phosphatidyltransferase family protein [Desulfurobacterium atlanticum]SNR59919.1 Phosphatidylglycerophosphate synthase [Desulfurobacterium atlanticum]